jgi:hypothetical protein
MMPPIKDEFQEGHLDDELFEQNYFGSQIKEHLDPELLQLLDDEFDSI